MPPLRLPKRLAGPATIGIFAPSGVVDAAALTRAVSYLEAGGHRVIVAPEANGQWRYFAGTDDARLAGFSRLLADPGIDVVMAARGGYGLTRLLSRIDFATLATTDKILVGFSDFTAFSLAAMAKSKVVTFAGPMAAVDFGNGDVSPFMEQHFWPLLSAKSHRVDVTASHNYAAQIIDGVVWGSNLLLLAHLIGTPYWPNIEGGILFVEEIAEQPYAIERLFFQLHHAGVLAKQRAIVLADFDDCMPDSNGRYPYSMAEVIDTLRKLLPVPVLTGLPFGHIRDKITIPVGGTARLAIETDGYSLTFSRYNSA